jgi:radical SAM superfamily enzyme YgiQ (UPF0313 family)
MRVLLVSTNRARAPQPVAPLGLGLVAAATAARGHEVRLLDLYFSRHPEADLTRALREWRPEAIGLSIRNLDNGESLRPVSHLPEAERWAQVCRAHCPAPLIVGGAAVNVAPEETLRRLGADYVVVGDGEVGLPEVLGRIEEGSGQACPTWRAEDLDALPHAEAGRWVDLPRYLRQGTAYPLQSKRGCAFHCSYCSYPLIEGETYRRRSPESVCAEIEEAIGRWRVRSFELVDSTFNHPYEHAARLCEALARRRFRAAFHTMGLNPATASRELFSLMRGAGFRSAVCATESGSEAMLSSLRKGFTAEHVAQTAAWAREAGLPTLWAFLFGAPGETEETVRETRRFIETALGPQDRIICTVGVRVYPGTEVARTALAEGLIGADTDLSYPVFYHSPHVTGERILELLDASPMRSRMMLLETIQRPSIAFAMRLRHALHVPGAAWAGVPLYNRAMRLIGRR